MLKIWTYRLDHLQVSDVLHFTLDELKNDTETNSNSSISSHAQTKPPDKTYSCRLISCLFSLSLTSAATSVCHSVSAAGPLSMDTWNARSCAIVESLRIASDASRRYSASGLPSVVSVRIASSRTGYRCRCSEGRVMSRRRSRRRASGRRTHSYTQRYRSVLSSYER